VMDIKVKDRNSLTVARVGFERSDGDVI